MTEDIIEDVSDLIMRSEAFRKLSESQDVYCPFEALGVARLEIRHSNFLADIIDPRGLHDFGDAFLRSFIETMLGEAEEKELRLTMHLEDLSDAIIFREWKNIDLLVRVPGSVPGEDLILVTEIKIEATESEDQLEIYESRVRAAWPTARIFYFFLTPNQTPASRESWTEVGFSILLDKFEDVLRNGQGQAKARALVESYISMMRRRYVENAKLEELALKIWARHQSALEFLVDRQPNPASELFDAITGDQTLEMVNTRLNEQGYDLTLITDHKTSRTIRFAVVEWDVIDGMQSGERWVPSNRICLFEMDVDPSTFHIRFVVGRGPQETRVAFVDAIDQANVEIKRRQNISADFTRICAKSIRTRKEMKRMIEDGIDGAVIRKAREDVVDYLCYYIGPFHDAFVLAGRF